jgi:hypothetical protein
MVIHGTRILFEGQPLLQTLLDSLLYMRSADIDDLVDAVGSGPPS